MQSADAYQKYVDAVTNFNALGSFQICLPHADSIVDNTIYNAFLLNLANKFTDKIEKSMIPALKKLEKHRNKKMVYTDMNKSNEICRFVVHLNQITNLLKPIDAPEICFAEPDYNLDQSII